MKTLKTNLIYLFMASMMLCLYSCGKDDPTTSSSTPIKTETNTNTQTNTNTNQGSGNSSQNQGSGTNQGNGSISQGNENNSQGSNNNSGSGNNNQTSGNNSGNGGNGDNQGGNGNANQGGSNQGGSQSDDVKVQNDDYIEVAFGGKTYSKKPNKQYYVQFDPVGYENGNEPLVLSFNGQEMFESNGFEFLYGIVHYKDENKLLNSTLSTYKVAKEDDTSNFYKNLTLTPVFEKNGIECELVSGTHEVQLIKKVNGHVVIVGKFSCKMKNGSNEYSITGKYQMTIP